LCIKNAFCVVEAEEISGTDALKRMKDTILDHVTLSLEGHHESKDTMFDKAKDVMLTLLKKLMV